VARSIACRCGIRGSRCTGFLAERFGDRIALCGNMDVAILATGTPAAITEATTRMLEVGSRQQRFAAGANTVVQDDTPVENYLAMVRTITGFDATA